jgi:hypothetical protein
MSAHRTNETGGFYRMGRAGIIALVVLIVLALAGAGLLAGALAGGSRPTGGSGDFKITTSQGAVGAAAPASGRLHQGAPARGSVVAGAGSVLLGFGGSLGQVSPTPTESPSPTETASPTAEPTESPGPVPTGEGISLDGGTVVVPLPEGWTQIAGDFNWTVNFDGVEGYLFGEVDSGIDPSLDAASVLPQVYQSFIVGDSHYSQLTVGEVESYQPFGGIVSRAGLWYQGLWSDTQGSYDFGGKMFVGIRGDGKAFLMTMEIYPAEDWNAGFANACSTVYVPAWASLAGEAWPYDPCTG